MDDDDDNLLNSDPYFTCFVFPDGVANTDYCWSRSYINKDGDWLPCKPQGYGSDGWVDYGNGGWGLKGYSN